MSYRLGEARRGSGGEVGSAPNAGSKAKAESPRVAIVALSAPRRLIERVFDFGSGMSKGAG
jgi:hypothetical protein